MAQEEKPKAETGPLNVMDITIASSPRPRLSPAPLRAQNRSRQVLREQQKQPHDAVPDARQASPLWNRSTASPSANALKLEPGGKLSLIKTCR
jgi:hypothetical protein